MWAARRALPLLAIGIAASLATAAPAQTAPTENLAAGELTAGDLVDDRLSPEALTADCDTRRDADSCMAMAMKSYEGRGVAMDHRLSRRFSAKACALGQVLGCNMLAALLEDGAGGPNDLEGAARNYRRACDQGYDGACFNLGQLRYNNYAGNPAHLVEARAMFARGCEAGFAQSCNNSAVMLKFGEGGPADLPAARALFEQACAAREANACGNLGAMLLLGEGGPADRKRAVPLLSSACKSGVDFACDLAASPDSGAK
ncbi:tetratricopeptide repeat protein [Citromicrobium bathyomarinum]